VSDKAQLEGAIHRLSRFFARPDYHIDSPHGIYTMAHTDIGIVFAEMNRLNLKVATLQPQSDAYTRQYRERLRSATRQWMTFEAPGIGNGESKEQTVTRLAMNYSKETLALHLYDLMLWFTLQRQGVQNETQCESHSDEGMSSCLS
jgi:hypothetical protein